VSKLLTGFAGCLVSLGISRGARKLVWISRVIKKKLKEYLFEVKKIENKNF